MKKVLVAIVAMALMVTLFGVVSNANGALCIDGAYLTSDPDGVAAKTTPWVPTADEKDVMSLAANGDIGNIYGLGYTHFHIQGWWGDSEDYTDLGIQYNDGDITWGLLIPDEGLPAAAGWAYANRYNITVPLQEGKIAMKFYKKTADGQEVIKTINYVNEESDEVTYDLKAISGNDGDPGKAVWLNEDGEYCGVKFTTTDALGGVDLFFWASNGTNGPLGSFKGEIFKFDTNIENTLAKDPVASKTHAWTADNTPGFNWRFDEPLEKGTYVLKFTIVGDTATGVDKETAYVVFPAVNSEIAEANFEYVNTDVKFNFGVFGNSRVSLNDFFAANPEEGTEPATQPGTEPTTIPQTGDFSVAMFAVIAVLAMGAAVVFMKKRSY